MSGPKAPKRERGEREAKLAAALRANLRRRKTTAPPKRPAPEDRSPDD